MKDSEPRIDMISAFVTHDVSVILALYAHVCDGREITWNREPLYFKTSALGELNFMNEWMNEFLALFVEDLMAHRNKNRNTSVP